VTASLAVRQGLTTSLAFYLDHGRVHVGDLARTIQDAFAAWVSDRDAGLDAIMFAPTRDLVAELNSRARQHRIGDAKPGCETRLADGNRASVGDIIITRTNDRRLRLSPTDWVKNGDRWTVTKVGRHGGLTVPHNRSQLTTRLPADYVRTSTSLGYATTIHSAQGVSSDTTHGLLTGQESRQQLYTMLSRGRRANHLYLQVVEAVADLDGIDQHIPGLTAEPAWPTLRAHLLDLAAETGDHPYHHLNEAARGRSLPAPATWLPSSTGAFHPERNKKMAHCPGYRAPRQTFKAIRHGAATLPNDPSSSPTSPHSCEIKPPQPTTWPPRQSLTVT
jgi:hypothetical protein